MAKIVNEIKEIDIDTRVQVVCDGVTHTGKVVRCGFTRKWGHMISEQTGDRIEFDTSEEGFKIL